MQRKFPLAALSFLASACLSCELSAELITFNLRDPNGNGNDTANTAGEQFENGATNVTQGGIQMNLILGGSVSYLADSNGGGLDTAGVNPGQGDIADAIDRDDPLLESFSFSFEFGPDTSLVLRELDLAGVGSNAVNPSDSALVVIGGGAPIRLGTGAADFNGTTDVWSPDLTITSGEVFTLTAEDSFSIQQIIVESFSTTPIPEPSAFVALGIGLLGMGVYRRRVGGNLSA